VGTLCSLLVVLPHAPWTLELAIASFCPAVRMDRRPRSPGLYGCRNVHVRDDDLWTTVFSIGLFGDVRWPLEERILSAQGDHSGHIVRRARSGGAVQRATDA
jgi:hypothetical protein